MKVALFFDVYGWCFETECEGLKKYSKYQCDTFAGVPDGRMELSPEVLSDYDIVFFSCPELFAPYQKFPRTAKVVCGVASLNGVGATDGKADVYNGVSREIADLVQARFPRKKVVYIPDGVDPEIFKPLNLEHSFTIGWAGNFPRREKRTYLLKSLDYPVKIKSDLIYQTGMNKIAMVQFYNSIDIVLLVSASEGCSLVPLEAAACKAAFVGTATGTVLDYIPARWLVPCNPEEIVIKELNEKLHMLEDNSSLLLSYKEQLHKKVLEEYTWKAIVKQHEALWESLI